MEVTTKSEDLAREALAELGTDIVYVRFGQTADEDRRFFTGVEIAIIVATQIAIRFWMGFVTAFNERAAQSGGRAGHKIASTLFDRLDTWLRLDPAEKETDLPAKARTAQQMLDESVDDLTRAMSRDEFRESLRSSRTSQLAQITDYLSEIGYRRDMAQRHATRLVDRLQQTASP